MKRKVLFGLVIIVALSGCIDLSGSTGDGSTSSQGELNLDSRMIKDNSQMLTYMRPDIDIPTGSTIIVQFSTNDRDYDPLTTTVESPISEGEWIWITRAEINVDITREEPVSPADRYTRSEIDNGFELNVTVETPDGEEYTETLTR